jgi:hypothetical protein
MRGRGRRQPRRPACAAQKRGVEWAGVIWQTSEVACHRKGGILRKSCGFAQADFPTEGLAGLLSGILYDWSGS